MKLYLYCSSLLPIYFELFNEMIEEICSIDKYSFIFYLDSVINNM